MGLAACLVYGNALGVGAAACGPGAFAACAIPCGLVAAAEPTGKTTYGTHSELKSDSTATAFLTEAIHGLGKVGGHAVILPVCWREWLADAAFENDVVQNDVGSYRAWVDMLAAGFEAQGLKIIIREARHGCLDSFGNHTHVNITWPDFKGKFIDHFAKRIGVEFEPLNQMVNTSMTPPSAGISPMDRVEVLKPSEGEGVASRIVGTKGEKRWLPAVSLAFAVGAKRASFGGTLLSATTAVLSQALPAQAGVTSCVACFVACCGTGTAAAACMLLSWNPAAFLTCAAAGCGAYCGALCVAVCAAPLP